MTEAKHTPGPWRLDRRASTRVVAGEDDTVATTGCQPSIQDSWDANARLIAAAPDMFNALCTLGRVLSQQALTTKEDELFAAYSQLLAAVTKARGA